MKYFYVALITAIVALGLTVAAPAQCPTGRRASYPIYTYSNTNQYPVKEVVVHEKIVVNDVLVPVAVPVLIPAFQFQYVAPIAVLPAAVPVAVPSAAPSAVPATQQSEDQRIKQLARILIAEMRKQQDGGSEDDGPPIAIGELASQPPQNNGGSNGPQNNGVASNAGSWTQFLSTRCGRCHTGATARSGIQIFTAAGQFNNSVDRQRLISAIEGGRMPQVGSPEAQAGVSPQDLANLKAGLSGR